MLWRLRSPFHPGPLGSRIRPSAELTPAYSLRIADAQSRKVAAATARVSAPRRTAHNIEWGEPAQIRAFARRCGRGRILRSADNIRSDPSDIRAVNRDHGLRSS